ncbi:MAG: HEAT repeat domain-containing protein [Bellilinea sp.]|nr:HEAT repeat domain-containing protein [Bellilinea sp.]
MTMATTPKRIVPFDDILAALLDDSRPFPPAFLHRFSDLTPTDLIKLKTIWPQISSQRRISLMEDLEELAEVDTLVFFDDLSIFALDDEEPRVRSAALRALWEADNEKLVSKFISMMEKDPDEMVRATAASTLGKYVYLGELEEISSKTLHQVEDHLLSVAQSSELPIIRRRAIEALGYSSRPEVKPLILSAYNNADPEWLCTALFAMGRSANEEYIPAVIEQLDHPDPEVQFEAVRAAGQLSAGDARETLLEMLQAGIEDDELRMAVIWSLSEIGGEQVREVLENLLDQTEDDEEADFLQEALDNLFLTEGLASFEMFDFEAQDEDDLNSIINLEDNEDEEEDNNYYHRNN